MAATALPALHPIHRSQLLEGNLAFRDAEHLQAFLQADAPPTVDPMADLAPTHGRLKALAEGCAAELLGKKEVSKMHTGSPVSIMDYSGTDAPQVKPVLSIPFWSDGREHRGMETWGDRAKAVLKQLSRTIDDLAEKRGMTTGGMQKWLAGTRQPNLDDIVAIADELGVSRAWLLLGDEAAGPLDNLPAYASQPLQQMADACRAGKLSAEWFECLSLAATLIERSRKLGDSVPGLPALGGAAAAGNPPLTDEAIYLAVEFDKVPDPVQRRLAFAQTQHMLRLMNQAEQGSADDTTSKPSARHS